MNATFTKCRALVVGLAMFVVALAPSRAGEAATLIHAHALDYSTDGKQLMISSHHGLALYENGKWSKGAGPAHDYMGFSATRDALYSSGHPALGSGLINPLGLIKSSDGGKSWKKLGLEGESDSPLASSSTHERKGLAPSLCSANVRGRSGPQSKAAIS